MSSTFVADSKEDKDDSLIIIVNADGTLTVDPETLQKLIANQHGGNVSVVRVDGEGGASAEDPSDGNDDASHINLTVEGFFSQQPQEQQSSQMLQDINQEPDGAGGDVVVDPFSQMEPEHLARLESALQSEQAKEILGTNLGDNLTEMLDILEGNDEPPTSSTAEVTSQPQLSLQRLSLQEQEITPSEQHVVHNDHSYTATTIAPPHQPPPSYHTATAGITSGQALSIGRPLTRGGRGRNRGTGRVLTRGGSAPRTVSIQSSAVQQQSQQQQQSLPPTPQQQQQQLQHHTMVTTVSTTKPVTTKNYIVSQGGRLITQTAVTTAGEAKVIQKKVETPVKTPVTGATARVATIAGPTTVSGSNAVIVRTTPLGSQKKQIISRGRGGRSRGGRRTITVSRGKGIPLGTSEQNLERDKKLEEELAMTLKAVEATPPSELIALGPKKKVSTVFIKKVIPKSHAEHSETSKLQNLQHTVQPSAQVTALVKSPKAKEIKIVQDAMKSSLKTGANETPTQQTVAVVRSVTTPNGSSHPSIKSPPITPVTKPSPSDGSISEENKKKKGERNSGGGGSSGSGSGKSAPPVVLGPELFSTPDIIRRVSTEKEASSPTKEGPKVQVQPLHPPIIPAKCGDNAENLIDMNNESAKEDSRFLTESLLLDDLTCGDDTVAHMKNTDNQIEQTLERMELGGNSTVTTTTVVPQQKVQKPSTQSPTNPIPQPPPYVRKLPPIELPATRSATKKAAAASLAASTTNTNTPTATIPKSETPSIIITLKDKKPGAIVKEKRLSSDNRKSIIEKKQMSNIHRDSDVDEEEIDSDDESWNSEDDPDRLWCICKKPHNNRFMICCDGCEEWFHGKCVGITKSLGQQMEQQGVEWSCPNCVEAKNQSKFTPPKVVQETPRPSSIVARTPAGQHTISSLECIVCKKPAKVQSNYCSDVCIKKHTLTMLATLKRETEGLNTATRVVVYEKKTGRLLTGEKAPTVQGLAEWLMSHPTFEVVRPSILPVNKYYIKAKDPPNKPNIEKPAAMKQTVLTSKITGTGVKTVSYAVKPAVTQKQTIQQAGHIQPKTVIQQVAVKDEEKPVRRLSKTNQQVIPLNQTVLSPTQEKNKSFFKEEKVRTTTPKEEKVIKSVKDVNKPVNKEEKVTAETIKLKKERKSRDSTSGTESAKGPTNNTTLNQSKLQEEAPATAKPQPEPIRANVKRTLQELLNQRIKADPELNNTNEDVKELVQSIEEELFNLFKDTGTKYKSKYRSLVFNIKDPKNLTLYRKIVDKAISPSQLVRLSPEELANQELAQWREKEAKHQIEIIKKNELDLIHQAKTVVLKSRKGEEVIESKNHEANISELESALNRTADDEDVYEKGASAVTDTKKEEEEAVLEKLKKELREKRDERKKEKRRDKKKDEKKRRSRSHHRSRSRSRHHRDKSRSDRKGSERRHSSERKHSSDRKHSSERRKSSERKHSEERKSSIDTGLAPENSFVKDEIKEETIKQESIDDEPLTPPPPTTSTITNLKAPKEEDLSDREPSSTVTIQTPPPPEEKPAVWTGVLNMSEVTKLYTSAYEVSGSCEDLGSELSSQLDCVGRIQPDSVWDYVSRMKKAGTKDIVVIRFQADSEEEKMSYLSLYSYLNSRNRMAVIGQISRTVKDFYVLPLASHSPIPQILLPLDGPGFDDYRPHLLLGIIIRNRRGPTTSISSSSVLSSTRARKTVEVVKTTTSKTNERSYTPPLPTDGSTTPPLSSKPPAVPRGLTPPLPDPEEEPYSPGEDDPYSPEDTMTEAIIVKPNPDIQRNLDEVNRMIEEKRQQIESMVSAVVHPTSAPIPPSVPPLTASTVTTVPSGSNATRNNYQTGGDDEEEAYSPSSSFTPPPATESIPFFDSKALPDIKLPSNLHEILASIKGQNTDSNSGVKSDPIVQAYANSQYTAEEDDDYSRSSSTSLADNKSDVSQEKQPRRDPRQSRIREMDKQQHKTSLSQLSDADLIRKAAEMERPVRPVVPATIPVSLPPSMPPTLPPNIPPTMPPTLPPPQVPKVMPPTPLPPLPTPDPNYFPYPPPLPPPPYPQQVYPKPPPPIMPPHPLPPPPKKRKDDYEDRRDGPPQHRRKWEHRDNMGHNMNRGRHHRGGNAGGHRPGFRGGNFDSSSPRMFRGGRGGNVGGGSGGYIRMRGGTGNMYRGSDSEYVPPHRVVSEWDEEIRNFEQRKAREFNRGDDNRDFGDRDNFEQRKGSRDFNRDDNRDFGDRDRRDRKRRASRSPSRHKSGRHRMRRASSGSS